MNELATATEPLDKRSDTIRDMFAGVAPRYDLINRLMSGRFDVRWRRAAAAALALPRGSRVLDLCCGTGDQALAVADEDYQVVAADFCLPMLALARTKYKAKSTPPAGLAGDTLHLPFPDASFDGATASFGLRNLEDLDAGLREVARVLRPAGRVSFLETAIPDNLLRSPHHFYYHHVLPRIGRWLSPRGSAYGYLRDSALAFPDRAAFVERLQGAGLIAGRWRNLAGGGVCLYTAHKERIR